MKGKIAFVLGAAVGYVLGTRAGRERYEQIKRGAQSVWNTPTVQRGVQTAQDALGDRVDELKATAMRAGKDAFTAFARGSAGGGAGTSGSSSSASNAASSETTQSSSASSSSKASASKTSGSKTSGSKSSGSKSSGSKSSGSRSSGSKSSSSNASSAKSSAKKTSGASKQRGTTKGGAA